MKFVKSSFLVFSALSALLLPNVANAVCSKTMVSGKFCSGSAPTPCKPGCYCTGGTTSGVLQSDVIKACAREEKNFIEQGLASLFATSQDMNEAHVFLCPDDFPYSNAGARSSEECYACENYNSRQNKCSGTKLYNKEIRCGVGEYLPQGSAECKKCEEEQIGSIKVNTCKGGKFKPSFDRDQGKYEPKEFTISNISESTATLYVTCDKGKYLPAGSLFCESCLNGYICPKTGTYTQKDQNQGLETCPDGRTPNEAKTACVASNSGTNAGNSSNKNNTNTNNNGTNSGNSGKNDNNTNTNNNGTNSGNSSKNDKTCPSILSKNQLKYGVSGDKECWLFLDIKPEKYKKCVCGE